jgi:type VI secretion system protein ImpF
MDEPKDRQTALASLLDRVTDEDPDREQEIPISGRKLERALREAIRRDIEGFLNTRKRCMPLPADLTNVHGTIVDYGVPDFMSQTLSTERQRKPFIRLVSEAILEHEPRFKSLEIEPVGDVDRVERSFHFRIHAVVHAEPAPESLSFDSRIEPVSRSFSVRKDQ